MTAIHEALAATEAAHRGAVHGRGPAATTTYALDWLNGGACLTQNLTRLDFTTAQAIEIGQAIEPLRKSQGWQ